MWMSEHACRDREDCFYCRNLEPKLDPSLSLVYLGDGHDRCGIRQGCGHVKWSLLQSEVIGKIGQSDWKLLKSYHIKCVRQKIQKQKKKMCMHMHGETINISGSPSSSYWTFSVAAEAISLRAFEVFGNNLYHCERCIIILLTEIICSILTFHVVNCQGKICSISTATEPGWNSREESICYFDNEHRSFSWFLLIPLHVIINVLAGFAGDGAFVSQSHWQKCWRLCEYCFCPGICLRKIKSIMFGENDKNQFLMKTYYYYYYYYLRLRELKCLKELKIFLSPEIQRSRKTRSWAWEPIALV